MMFKHIARVDAFSRNIVLVFIGTSIANFLNLLYQLLIAHRLSPQDFAAFNTLLSIYVIIAMPLGTIQTAIAKYSAEFNANHQDEKNRYLFSFLLKKGMIAALATFFLFCLFSFFLTEKLKIPSFSAGYLLALLLAVTWIIPVFSGAMQGLELFWWVVLAAIISGIFKLIFAFIFLKLGLNISGALAALLFSVLIGLGLGLYALRSRISLKGPKAQIDWKQFSIFLFPVAVSFFCFSNLVTSDMIMVQYFFPPQESGFYSLAQILGKIFLFLPGAISLVMFPRVSGLSAANLSTLDTVKKSLSYVAVLCIAVSLTYNLFPALILRILTGKVFPEVIVLGRLFSISMAFFTLSYLLLMYFLSIKDLRFIKFLVLSAVLQFMGIVLFHQSLAQVQLVLCVNSILLFLTNLRLVYKKQGQSPNCTSGKPLAGTVPG